MQMFRYIEASRRGSPVWQTDGQTDGRKELRQQQHTSNGVR